MCLFNGQGLVRITWNQHPKDEVEMIFAVYHYSVVKQPFMMSQNENGSVWSRPEQNQKTVFERTNRPFNSLRILCGLLEFFKFSNKSPLSRLWYSDLFRIVWHAGNVLFFSVWHGVCGLASFLLVFVIAISDPKVSFTSKTILDNT